MRKGIIGALVALLVTVFGLAAVSPAFAVGYRGVGNNVTVGVGETGTMTFVFDDAGTVGTQAVATAGDAVTIAVLRAGTATKTVDSARSVSFAVSSNTAGVYTVNVTANGDIATATLTVTPADSGSAGSTTDGGLSGTGYDLPLLLIWTAVGAVLLGVALFFTLRASRKRSDRA